MVMSKFLLIEDSVCEGSILDFNFCFYFYISVPFFLKLSVLDLYKDFDDVSNYSSFKRVLYYWNLGDVMFNLVDLC